MTPSLLRERIFPTLRPVIPGLDYFGDWRPAHSTSADYIDYFKMSDGHLGLAVGDVRGQGVPPALLKTSLHSMMRALRIVRNFSLKGLMRNVDRIFSEVSPDNSYATLFVGEYNPTNGRLRYVNAGHEPPFVLRRNGSHFQTIFLEPGGPVLGMLRESAYREGVVSLRPGDVLVAYTDGLCETTNETGEEFGWPRFLRTVEEVADRRARDIVDAVLQSAEIFAGSQPPRDDATLFVGRILEAMTVRPRWDVKRMAAPVAA